MSEQDDPRGGAAAGGSLVRRDVASAPPIRLIRAGACSDSLQEAARARAHALTHTLARIHTERGERGRV